MDRSGAMPEVNNSRRTRTTVLCASGSRLAGLGGARCGGAQEPVQAARGSERTRRRLGRNPAHSTAAPLAQSRGRPGRNRRQARRRRLGQKPRPARRAQPAQSRATQSETASKRVDDALGRNPAQNGGAACAIRDRPRTRTASERIEEALGERASPLDAVAVDVQNAEYDKAEAFLTAYIRALEAARHRYHADLVRPHILPGGRPVPASRITQPPWIATPTAVHVSRVSDGPVHTGPGGGRL